MSLRRPTQPAGSDVERFSPDSRAPARPETAYGWYVLAILLALNILNVVDRNLPFILIEAIRRDIPMSDTAIGLLGGVVFTLVYALVSLPAARLADRGGRTRVIAVAAILWTAMTGAAGLTASFAQLAFTRVGLAVGESAIAPAATSLIADLFDSRRRTALAIYFVGSSLGVMVGLGLGGWIGDRMSWRAAFMVFAAVGLAVAGLFALTVREPARDAAPVVGPSSNATRADWRGLWRNRVFRHLALGSAAYMFAVMSNAHFAPAYMMRRFEVTSAQAGLCFGVIMGLCGALGTIMGGMIGDRLARRGGGRSLVLPAVAVGLSAPLYLLVWLAPDLAVFLVLLPFPSLIINAGVGPIVAAAQATAPVNLRATSVAVLTFGMYAVGGSLGPLVTGVVSDALKPSLGADSLRWSLALATLALPWAATHIWLAQRAAAAEAASDGSSS